MHKRYSRKREESAKECGTCGTVWKDSWVERTMGLVEFAYDKRSGGVTKKMHTVTLDVDTWRCPFCDTVDSFEKSVKLPRIIDKVPNPNDPKQMLIDEIVGLERQLEDMELDMDLELPPDRLRIINDITILKENLSQI
jgi:hypothetical protein